MKKIFLFFCFICLYLIACNEEPNSPTIIEQPEESSALVKTDKRKITMGTIGSDNPLSGNEALKNKIEIRTIGNISIFDERSSLLIMSDDPNNYFLPKEIKNSTKDLSYKSNGKNKIVPSFSNNEKIKQIFKENRAKTDKWKDKEKINWNILSTEEKISKWNELGYNVISLGNDLYELSRDFDPLDNGNVLNIKTTVDIKTQIPKSSKIYKDGKLIAEHLNEGINGKSKSYSKIYSKNGLREDNNFVIINENE